MWAELRLQLKCTSCIDWLASVSMSDLTSSSCSCPTIHADIKDKDGNTALDRARESGYNDIVKLITNFKPPPRGELHMIVMSDLD